MMLIATVLFRAPAGIVSEIVLSVEVTVPPNAPIGVPELLTVMD